MDDGNEPAVRELNVICTSTMRRCSGALMRGMSWAAMASATVVLSWYSLVLLTGVLPLKQKEMVSLRA